MKLPELRKASYNDVCFSVPQSTRNMQHALVSYHSPYANHSLKDDLGLASEKIHVQAFVSGSDAYQRAAALRQELDKRGQGTLVHPSFGKINAYVQSVEEIEDYAQGLFYVAFSIKFLRADEGKELGSIHAAPDLKQQGFALQKEFAAAAERRIKAIPKEKQLSMDPMRKELADLNNKLQNLYRLIQTPFAFIENLLLAVDELQNLILTPFEISAAISNMTADLAQAILSVPGKMLLNLRRTVAHLKQGFSRLDALANGQTLEQYEMQLQASAGQLVALFYPAEQAINSEAQSQEQAKELKQDVDALLQTIKLKIEYQPYEKLIELEQAFGAAIVRQMASLPRQKKLHSNEPLPVALHRLQAKSIASVPNPFFPNSNSNSNSNSNGDGVWYV